MASVQFVTVCVRDRKPLLAQDSTHQLLVGSWAEADGWLVGRYVVMPDHVHLFCSERSPQSPPLAAWVRYWKGLVTRIWPSRDECPFWQRDFWDTGMRSRDQYERKWEYVRLNPVRAGLVGMPEEWPYAGELNDLGL